jgi:transposase
MKGEHMAELPIRGDRKTIRLSNDLRKKIAILAINKGKSQQEIITMLLNAGFKTIHKKNDK